MKKIAMVFPYAPSYRAAIYRGMDESMDVHWFFAGDAERKLRLLDYSSLNNCNLEMSEMHIGPITCYKGLNNLGLDRFDYIIIAGVIKCISEWRLIFRYGRRKERPKIILWTHGWYGKETFIQRVIKKIFFSFADAMLLYGNYAKEGLIKQGVSPGKLFVIHNSLDYDQQLSLRQQIQASDIYKDFFHNTDPVLIFLGRLTNVKRLDLLLEAVAVLRKDNYFVNVVLVGDGEMRQSLREKAGALALEGRVWFYGECFDEKKNAELLYNADLCVAPGNVGLTAIHSLMFGCPVLTHNDFKWQMPEFEAIRPNETGDFFNRDDVQSMAEHIKNWLMLHGENRDEVRAACYKEIDNGWTPDYQMEVINNAIKSIESL